MVGLSAGTLTVLRGRSRTHPFRRLKIVQFSMLIFPLFIAALLSLCHRWSMHHGSTAWIGWIFPVLAAGAGFLGGIQFPLANRLACDTNSGTPIHTSAGKLYSLDLMGSSLGVLFTSAFLIPILGVYSTLFILSFLNACTLLILFFATPPDV